MLGKVFLVVLVVSAVTSLPQTYETKNFKVGIEYDHSLPMEGGSDRYRHRNNYDPFFVTITASAKNNYVISYLEVTATVAASGEIDFCLTRGTAGSRSMVFQLASNHSEFLAYSYLAYGIREDEYRKMNNIISLPLPINKGTPVQHREYCIITLFLILTHFILMR